ncbi:Eukaryotic translation initiation factor 3 subunit A [Trifolium repens]|nr:Eukaryotic translation initiation factor 3 subunit A [Trifolium repens]
MSVVRKDRSDWELVTPWFKFNGKPYRTVLEILRNNSKLEALYAYGMVSVFAPAIICLYFKYFNFNMKLSYLCMCGIGFKPRAFQFCKQYKRTTEFRRLCEIIINHLANLNKYRDQRDRLDLSASESLQLYLDTRFEQLKIATELELWQEAFRYVEDIHGLMLMVKKTPKPSLIAEKCSQGHHFSLNW